MTFVIAILVLVIILTPGQFVTGLLKAVRDYFVFETMVKRGEGLVHWMGVFSPEGVGFNLDCKLPEKNIYKNYGVELHHLWEQVRVYGGGLSKPLKSLRYLLRKDIKFEKSKKAALNGAWAQVVIMLALSWSYLFAFIYLEITKTNVNLIIGIVSWQILGAVGHTFLIKVIEQKSFAASRFFLHHVTKLTVTACSGGSLSSIESPCYLEKLSREESTVYNKLEELIIRAREKGQLKVEDLKEVEEEYWFCLEQKIETFLGLLKKSSFAWSLIFILPTLFVTTLFSFAEIMANNS